LHHRLDVDLRFCYQCGFRLNRPAPFIPTLSRVFAEITKKGLAKQLFEDVVTTCQNEGIIDGSHAAIHAYEKKQPNRANKPAMPTGGQNLISLVIKSNGLVTSFILPSISKVNFRWLLK
jgi:hypothetical protein